MWYSKGAFANLAMVGQVSPTVPGLIRPVLGRPLAGVCLHAPHEPDLGEPMFASHFSAWPVPGLIRPVLGRPLAGVCLHAPHEPDLGEPMFASHFSAWLTAQPPKLPRSNPVWQGA
jgi:hypothetical protein